MHEQPNEYPIQWYEWSTRKRSDYLQRIYSVAKLLSKDPNLKQTQISKLTKIPRQTIGRIISELENIGALRKTLFIIASDKKIKSAMNIYRYDIEPQFLKFLETVVDKGDAHKAKPRGFDPAHSQQETKEEEGETDKPLKIGMSAEKLLEMTQEERDNWARNGFFRVHGFQRSWTLRNYTLVDDEELWYKLATTMNPDTVENPVRKVMLGKKRNMPSFIILTPSEVFRGVKYQLHFKKKKLIVSLPKESSIWIPWDEFREDLEQIIEQDIREVVEKAIKAYNMWFKQQVLAYDDGWVGKKKPLRPEVGYIDPDGIIHKVYEVEGATYIEELGFWIDASLKPNPEGELEDIQTASKFKKAMDVLASGELYEMIEEVDDKLEEVKKEIVSEVEDKMKNIVREIVVGAVETAMVTVSEKLVEMSYAGGVTIQQQFTEIWKRIAEMQEAMQFMIALNLVKGDKELEEELRKKLMKKLGMGV